MFFVSTDGAEVSAYEDIRAKLQVEQYPPVIFLFKNGELLAVVNPGFGTSPDELAGALG